MFIVRNSDGYSNYVFHIIGNKGFPLYEKAPKRDRKAKTMAVKTNQALKKQKKLEKQAKVDKVTNWFMINLAWGVFGFIVLRYMSNPLMTDYENTFKAGLGKFAIFFGIVAVLLLVWGILGKCKVLKDDKQSKDICAKLARGSKRAFNYGIFTVVVTAVFYYLSVYNEVRYFILNKFAWLYDTPFQLQEWWTTNGLSYAIGIYLLGAFIYTAVKIAIIEKKK